MATDGSPNSKTENVESVAPPSPPRRPYVAPRLRHLGSVRDLTLAGSGGALEGGRMMAM